MNNYDSISAQTQALLDSIDNFYKEQQERSKAYEKELIKNAKELRKILDKFYNSLEDFPLSATEKTSPASLPNACASNIKPCVTGASTLSAFGVLATAHPIGYYLANLSLSNRITVALYVLVFLVGLWTIANWLLKLVFLPKSNKETQAETNNQNKLH